MPYLFSGADKTITLQGSGSVTFTVNDLYSRWVDWVSDGGAGFDEVIKHIGGEDIGGGQTAGVYVFIDLGWSLVIPADINQVEIQGNLVRDPEDTSGAPLIINQGAALVILEKSQVAIGYSTSGGAGLTNTQANQLATLFNATTAGTGTTEFSPSAFVNIPTGAGGFESSDRTALLAIADHTTPLAAQLGLIPGITATHAPDGITVSSGPGSTTITDNQDGSYTVEIA